MPATQQETFNPSLTVVLPVYQEEDTIVRTINTVVEALNAWVSDFEVIVVSDGSKDRTRNSVKAIIASDARVHLLEHTTHQDYNAALVVGLEHATKEYVFYMAMDGQFDIHDLCQFFPLLRDYDGVFGYRLRQQNALLQKLITWIWNFIVRFVFGVRVRDVNCAFKLFNTEFFRTQKLESQSILLFTEMIYKFARAGYTYTQVGVRHLPVEKSHRSKLKIVAILRSFYDIFFYANKWYNEEHRSVMQTQRASLH